MSGRFPPPLPSGPPPPPPTIVSPSAASQPPLPAGPPPASAPLARAYISSSGQFPLRSGNQGPPPPPPSSLSSSGQFPPRLSPSSSSSSSGGGSFPRNGSEAPPSRAPPPPPPPQGSNGAIKPGIPPRPSIMMGAGGLGGGLLSSPSPPAQPPSASPPPTSPPFASFTQPMQHSAPAAQQQAPTVISAPSATAAAPPLSSLAPRPNVSLSPAPTATANAASSAPPSSASSSSSVPIPCFTDIVPVPEDHPPFWRDLNQLRSNTTGFVENLDEFMARVFLTSSSSSANAANGGKRKKEKEAKEKGGMFSFVKTGLTSVTNPLLQHLASPTSASSNNNFSASSASLLSASAAAVGVVSSPTPASDRVVAAAQGLEYQKNKAFLNTYANKLQLAQIPPTPPTNNLPPSPLPPPQSLTDIAYLITQLSQQKLALDDRLEQFERYCSQFHDSLSQISHKLNEHEETKKVMINKMQKYLGHKVGTNVEKALEQEKKIRTRRQLMSGIRFDVACDLRRLSFNEELSVLRPMSSILQLYSDFFTTGYKLIQPVQGHMAELNKRVKELEELQEKQSLQFAMSKRQHDSAVHATLPSVSSTAALSASLSGTSGGGSGIRDLDSAARISGNQTKACEKEGYLYLPAPAFAPVYASISNGRMVINRESTKESELHIDLLICTVKENRDNKLRWCFNLISPMLMGANSPNNSDGGGGLLLQADSIESFQEWMNVIQNAIGQQLNAGNGKRGNNATDNMNNTSNNSSTHHSSHHKTLPGFADALSSSPPLTSPTLVPTLLPSSMPPLTSTSSSSSSSSSSSVPTSSSSTVTSANFTSNSSLPSTSVALQTLRPISGNELCADCSAQNPDWLSLNLGIIVCMECSGVHRALGVHISKVRSTTLDKLDRFMIAYVAAVGNNTARNIWEASLMLTDASKRSRPNPQANAAMREMFIRSKYEIKQFLSPLREKNKEKLNQNLFDAICTANIFSLLECMAWGGNPCWPNPKEENRCALHQAVMYSNTIVVECVIQFMTCHTEALNQRELRGWTPIHYAAYQNDKNLVELLILRGGSQLACEVDNEGHTPLAFALKNAAITGEAIDPEMKQLLLAAEEKVRQRNVKNY